MVVSSWLTISSVVVSVAWGQAKTPITLKEGTALVEGSVIDADSKQPIIGAIITANSQSGTMRSQQVITNNGTYQLILDPKQPYVISIKAEGYSPLDEQFMFTSAKVGRVSNKVFSMFRIENKPAGTIMAKRMHPADILAPAEGIASVAGSVIGTDNVGLTTATVQIKSEQGNVLAQTETAYEARFLFHVNPRYSYRIVAIADGYKPYDEPLVFTSTSRVINKAILLNPINATVSAQSKATPTASNSMASVSSASSRVTPPKTLDAKVVYTPPLVVAPTGKTTQLRAIQFVQSKAELLPDAQPALEQLLAFLTSNPTAEIELSGHTDNQGDFDENIRLSKQRVDLVKDLLVKGGIAANRVVTRGYGPTRPIASNNSEATRQLNRRVEMIVIKQ